MPPIQHKDCREDAVYWPVSAASSYNDGLPRVGSPEEIKVRWTLQLRTGTDARGNNVTTTVTIAALRKTDSLPVRLALDSLIWLGTLDAIPGTSNEPTSDLWQVVTESTAKDVRGRNQRYEYGLMRHHDRLPTKGIQMAQIKGLNTLVNKLEAMSSKAKKEEEINVEVGYTAAYALYVHENRQMKWAGKPRRSGTGVYWGPRGRAGFLLDVAREMSEELAGVIRDAILKQVAYWKALKIAGLRLQRESQRNVPVEYGNLRASAFTRVTGKEE